MTSWTSGDSTRGPTVSTYRSASFSVRCPQYATAAGVVSSAASTRQVTAAIERPREGRCGGAVSLGVEPEGGELVAVSVGDIGPSFRHSRVGHPRPWVLTHTV